MGEFSTAAIITNAYSNRDFSFNINVIEHNAGSFDADNADKIVYTGSVKFSLNENAPNVILPQAILINPQKMYEIKLSTMDYMKGTFLKETWQSAVKLDADVDVAFFRNPATNKNDRSGLISSLTFKRI